jgi:cellulose synthase/poly-beta-1,6-N-acetylglucosamine synthase-like glycosyltransferase
VTRFVFWVSAGLVAYTYVGFPILLMIRAALSRRLVLRGATSATVSMIVAAHNEEDWIAAKLNNALSLSRPPDEVVVGSDGSTDRTHEIVTAHPDPRIRLVPCPRQGKPATLNAAVAASSGDILVFTDANSLFDADALERLLEPFVDARVGGVAGDQRYDGSGESNAGERAYWSYDRLLKRAESLAGSTVSATGAIYAIRRPLFRNIPDGVMDDFVISARVVEQGHRLVFEERAISREPVAATLRREFDRKVRIIMGGLYGVWVVRGLLNPFRHGFYAIQLFSRKVLRRLVIGPLIALSASSLVLRKHGSVYRWSFAIQAIGCGLGIVGLAADRLGIRVPRVVALPAYFVAVNWAALVALGRLLTGNRVRRWDTRRPGGRSVAGEEASDA